MSMPKTLDYFEKSGYTYEVIIVNDASTDKTVEAAEAFATYKGKQIDLKVVSYKINKGKGGAVRTGMLLAKGD